MTRKSRAFRRNAVLTVDIWGGYLLAFVLLHPLLGIAATVLTILPVLAIG